MKCFHFHLICFGINEHMLFQSLALFLSFILLMVVTLLLRWHLTFCCVCVTPFVMSFFQDFPPENTTLLRNFLAVVGALETDKVSLQITL